MTFTPATDDEALQLEEAVRYHLLVRHARDEADRRYEESNRAQVELPPRRRLDAFTAEPDPLTAWRISGLQPAGARALLAAQYKAGKTTLVGNVIRSLADGDPFLGRYEVVRPDRVALLDDELDENMLRIWLREQGIENGQQVDVYSLRGRLGSFNILDDATRARWAEHLAGVEYVVLDCLRPVLDALGLSEDKDAGRFLVAFDALLYEAGAKEALVVHHMGHQGERTRGDSRLLDWPDVGWKILRAEPDNPASARFFSAYGRGVDIPEGRMIFDEGSRRLSYSGGSRRDEKAEAALSAIVEVLAERAVAAAPAAALSGREIKAALADSEHSKHAIDAALKLRSARELLATEDGPRGAKLHRIARPCASCGNPLTAGQIGRHLTCVAAGRSGGGAA
ncbi:AAA family ATPase [Tsukamurella asaccharolytica]|uniref:AAA family ATPase n=1 Tax=Tsukamurella asaccharolytica TaxID=2592067 RepID=A0A5C5RBY6_9ACTN|nr:AAA family ATPase [Tsukamurella asaccharolytica]TWS20637.1 AAA family ATPase [Tsukamurella asaccharolytica]